MARPDPIARAVARRMLRQGITQRDVADAMGTKSAAWLSRWINGHRSISVGVLIRVLTALGRLERTIAAIDDDDGLGLLAYLRALSLACRSRCIGT